MGGLKKALPITYWTFLIGSLAIAGVPFLSGFFSKDEILLETFAHGHWILWLIGALTSLLTATYMFRARVPDVPRRAQACGRSHGTMQARTDTIRTTCRSHRHDAGSHLHDAPPAMALALIVLAIGSVVAGYIGVPHALGGSNLLGAWLEPRVPAPSGRADAPEVAKKSLELTLMVVSSVIALVGIGLAAFIWLKRREIADSMARSFSGLYTPAAEQVPTWTSSTTPPS